MKERPILFSAPMVRAILDGRKTQTRRVVSDKVPAKYRKLAWGSQTANSGMGPPLSWCPYGRPGDRLWVRENFTIVPVTAYRMSEGVQQTVSPSEPDYAAVYAAGWDRCIPRWKPSIHMPRWASRITLEITDVRVERLRDITDADALAEGVDQTNTSIGGYATERFKRLWESINGPESWGSNPWVWVVEFKRVQP